MTCYPLQITMRLSVLKHRKFTIAFLIWMVFITYSSLATFPETDAPRIDIPHFDKLVHFVFYFVAAILATFFVRESTNGNFPFRKTLWFVVFGAIVFGIIIEALQYTVTVDREGDWLDACANSLGAVVGTWAMKSYFSSQRRLKWKN